MKILHLSLLEPRDCFGKKPDGRKTLIKEATRDAPALYAVSELESYRNLMVVEIAGVTHKFEFFVTPAIVDVEGPDKAALYILREMSHEATEIMRQTLNDQINNYMRERPHASS